MSLLLFVVSSQENKAHRKTETEMHNLRPERYTEEVIFYSLKDDHIIAINDRYLTLIIRGVTRYINNKYTYLSEDVFCAAQSP